MNMVWTYFMIHLWLIRHFFPLDIFSCAEGQVYKNVIKESESISPMK